MNVQCIMVDVTISVQIQLVATFVLVIMVIHLMVIIIVALVNAFILIAKKMFVNCLHLQTLMNVLQTMVVASKTV